MLNARHSHIVGKTSPAVAVPRCVTVSRRRFRGQGVLAGYFFVCLYSGVFRSCCEPLRLRVRDDGVRAAHMARDVQGVFERRACIYLLCHFCRTWYETYQV